MAAPTQAAQASPRVLLTGANGFTGRHLTALLNTLGWEVWAIDRSTLNVNSLIPPDRRLQADLLDDAALHAAVQRAQPQAVVHLAAIAFVGHGSADDLYRVNVMGTRHLLHALAQLPVPPRCVLLASSANVYGNGQAGALPETAPLHPANDYAVSKLAMEHLARLWLPHLPIVLVRPFNYTGRGQSPQFLIAKVVDHVRRRAPVIELGNLDVARDFSDVRDVAQAYARLLDHACAGQAIGQVFNVGAGRTHALREVLERVQAISGHTMAVQVNPAFVRANEVRTLRADTTALEAAIGEWRRHSLDDTLRWMLAD
ncbi:GDP-mannose 4,6 dehydratase [Comamonas serinivorans]|uniref:GDP-mannose 4,6 dehydratase n=1 Tax=Comamonas serinivorans TaxID=1082851 RepID=A0A1Y0EJ24_9BURK|nr:NAD-dependent epimerase/dehydratase family protein [Comamonas serinivorans]ARU03643.1 GDP-mannose 4,6 dehydratase [Comamonas serinivorans]